jgi:hypothetical protein
MRRDLHRIIPLWIGYKMGLIRRRVGDENIDAETSSIDPKVAAEPSVLKGNLECMVINVFVDIEPSECIKCVSIFKSLRNTPLAEYWEKM